MAKKIVIIGNGTAGHTVAVSLRELNSDCKITLISEEIFPYYDKGKLAYYLAGQIKEKELFFVNPDFYEKININFLKDRHVVTVSTARRYVYCKYKEERENTDFDYLVVCSGRKTVMPEISGINKEGVFKLDNLTDYKELRAHLLSDTVCLFGEVQSGLEIAKSLNMLGKDVKIITTGEFDNSLKTEKLDLIQSEVVELIGESGIQAIKLKEGKIIGSEIPVFLTSWQKANLDFLKDTNINTLNDFLVVDDNMNTSIKNIFACGSVCVNKESNNITKSWDDIFSESKLLASHLNNVIGGN